ncbi:transcription factor WEREWOLF, putative [Entamoeba dispar SAW760]|uniref:Transcription factor WEREWOLF, putative n=1 Tax=Entamoeba dispar (strain ATCC PRA-260 / SAW760) TaxID=370354 RepID=B0EJ86_ENTDS|nr:transcription factor WEREWOLF, putative [Entamoeba dispar SAW760]EDR25394.1 transcription factor WEREWOLF, putative [Entamoeba dispar SAW760]|eukprot:EDR25394.1 transcription factor WEREWOLF, putative [Entamoeba dispar SAW760]
MNMTIEQNNYIPNYSFIYESEKVKKQRKAGIAWRKEEDQKLLRGVEMFGEKSWVEIAKFVGTRSRKQCRERFINHIDPGIDKRPWSSEEDEKILLGHCIHGSKWSEISKKLSGRTARAVRNRYKALSIRNKLSCFIKADQNLFKVINGGPIW